MSAQNQQSDLQVYERLYEMPPSSADLQDAARTLQGFFELLIEIDREQTEQGYERQ